MNKFKSSWAKNVESSDSINLMELYSEDAVLKPTLSFEIRQGKDEISPYFTGEKGFNDPGFLNRGIHKVKFLDSKTIFRDDFVIDVGKYEFQTDTETVLADYTFILETVNDELKILSHHSSLTFSK